MCKLDREVIAVSDRGGLASQPATGPEAANLTWSWWLPDIGWLVLTVTCAFSGFFLTLAALPYWAASTGTPVRSAGLVTTVMLVATVATQSVVPSLMRSLGSARTLALGLLWLGLPAPLYPLDSALWWILALSTLRGLGFALVTVVSIALLARFVPAERRARAIGVHGLAVNLPNLVAVPAGVLLVASGHVVVLSWIAALPAVAALATRPLARKERTLPDDAVERGAGRAFASAHGALAPAVVLLMTCICAVGLMTFLPIDAPSSRWAAVGLLGFGITATVTRWKIGLLADHWRLSVLFAASVLLGALGMLAVAVALEVPVHAFAAVSLGGCLVMGVGYGGVQNLSLVAALGRVAQGAVASASAVWNIAFDTGLAVGALGIGLLAGSGPGMSLTFGMCAAALAAMARPAVTSSRLGQRSTGDAFH